jgi:hypothetical protein
MYLHHPHKMNKQTLRSRHFWESSQHWKKHENPGASWSPGLETDINSRIWEPVNDLVQRLDHRLLVKFLLQESCVRSPCCFKTILLIDVDRTLYTLTTGPMAWVVLKINLDMFWWFCMSLHVQVLLFFLFELIVWILATGDPCRSVAGDVPSAEVNFHKLGCSGFFSSEVCLGLGPDGAKFGSINEWRLL